MQRITSKHMSKPLILTVYITMIVCFGLSFSSAAGRHFTVNDDIEFTYFEESPFENAGAIVFAPDGRYFSVQTTRGVLRTNRCESSIRIYRTADILAFLRKSSSLKEPNPFWVVAKLSYKDGPVISHLRWLRDSSAVVFLAKTATDRNQLFLADMKTKSVRSLTPKGQDVMGFDVRSSKRFVYSIRSPLILDSAEREQGSPGVVGTGRSLQDLIFPVTRYPSFFDWYDLNEVWAMVDGKRFRVEDRSTKQPLFLHLEGAQALGLAPDGRSVVTVQGVSVVPREWESLYAPPSPSAPYRIRAGRQNVMAFEGMRDVTEYVVIELDSGRVLHLTDAPTGDRAGWYGLVTADWSPDSKFVALSNTFLSPAHGLHKSVRPCIAVAEIKKNAVSCVEYLKARTAK
jgi:hypothetical protein